MKIVAIIEKGSDGMYSIRSEQSIGDNYLGGFGNTITEAKDDFFISIKEALEDNANIKLSLSDILISYKYDLPSFFNEFEFINVSKFATFAGVNESKMRQYKSGIAYPSEKTIKKILLAIHRIGTEFTSVSL